MIENVQMSDTIGELVTAVTEFQKSLPHVAKGNTAKVDSSKGSYSYDYADLTDVSDATIPALAAVGLAWITMPNMSGSGMFLDWMLAHTSGEHIRGSVPIGSRGDRWQDIGSAETYARRYCLVALTGVAPGGDDNDGENASAGRQAPQKVYLAPDLYDLQSVDSEEAAKAMFYVARSAGHLNHLVVTPEGSEVPFADWLRITGAKFPKIAPEAEPKAEADAQAEADRLEEAERLEMEAVRAHERELAEQETAQSPRADEDAPKGDR